MGCLDSSEWLGAKLSSERSWVRIPGPTISPVFSPYTGDVDSGWRLIHRVRACNWHYACTSRQWHPQGFGRKKCRVVLPSRGPRLEKRKEGCHVSKTWEYKEHLNRSVACSRLWISLLGWEPGFSLWWLTYWQERDDNLCGEIGTSCNSSDWITTCWPRVR